MLIAASALITHGSSRQAPYRNGGCRMERCSHNSLVSSHVARYPGLEERYYVLSLSPVLAWMHRVVRRADHCHVGRFRIHLSIFERLLYACEELRARDLKTAAWLWPLR